MFSSALRPAGERNGNGNGHSHGDVLLQADGLEAEFQRIKTGIHRELLDSLAIPSAIDVKRLSSRNVLRTFISSPLKKAGS